MVSDATELNWSTVRLSEIIARGLRLEASVFDVEGKKAKQIIDKCNCEKRTITGENGIATAYTCGRFKRIWVEQSEYPIYQPSSILDVYPRPDGYLSKKTNTDIEKLRVKKGQVLITCSGTIGKTCYVSNTLDQKIFSHDLLRIDCKDPKDAGYLYAFAKSDIGFMMLITNQYGAVISHIEAEHLNDVSIPYPDAKVREKISQKIEDSFRLRDESNELWEKATAIIYESLNLKPFITFKNEVASKDVNTFSVKLSSLNERFDGSYHDIVVTEILRHLNMNSCKMLPLGDTSISESIFLPQRFKRVYVSKGHGTKLFGIKQITSLDPFTDKYLAMGCISKKCQDELLLEPGMILISRSGTIGNMCIVPPHWKGWIASEDLIRVKVRKELEGYVYCFLASDYGQAIINRYAFGAVQDHIDCEQVAQFAIPILNDESIMQKINAIVLDVNQKRNDAYLLEQEALRILKEEVLS